MSIKEQTFTEKTIYNPKVLFWFYILMNLVPSLYFTTVDILNPAAKAVLILFPLGLYFFAFSLFKNTGRLQVVLFPLLFLHAFQIVLFFLFGKDVIAADMFLNVVTTNVNEATELLGSLIPAIIVVCLLYIPTTFLATLQWTKKIGLNWQFRKKILASAIVLMALSLILSFFSNNHNTDTFAFNEDVYPVNVIHNLGFAINKLDKIKRYPKTSKDFVYHASRQDSITNNREIYVMVIGETSRADNWALYGYDRNTNPKLQREENLVVFQDAITQSNTTHKSLSIMLSDASAENYHVIYSRKGVITAFKEAGFKTAFISNQAENGSFAEFFSKEADIYKVIRQETSPGVMPNHQDQELIPIMNKVIQENSENLFIVLHSYGSHFNYSERYSEEFSIFKPDQVTKVGKKERNTLINAYDNSILSTDSFLQQVIESLKETEACSSLFYSSDHGEDIFDDERNRFLHASPSPTYYQLKIPMLFWYSTNYESVFPNKVKAIQENKTHAITTNAIFHTLLDMAAIETKYLEEDLSLTSKMFKSRDRMYLSDHDDPIPYQKMNLKKQDFEMIQKKGLKK